MRQTVSHYALIASRSILALLRYVRRLRPAAFHLDRLRADAMRWGWVRSLCIRVVRGLDRYAGLRIYRVNLRPLVRRSPDPYLQDGIALRVALPEDLFRAAEDPELDLRSDFIRSALARGDMAFGAFEGDRLVAYTWRTFTAAPDQDGLWAQVDRPCQYSYKGFTRSSHRGRRLHVAVTYLADSHLLERGYTAEVGFVGLTNFSSRAVAEFLGRRRVGYAGCVKWFGRCVPFRTPGARAIGARLFEPR